MLEYQEKRILIWGKTYPELSTKHFETVCTGGVFEDNGLPVRLYPIPFRYLQEQFKKYQWITAKIVRNPKDLRPESYRIDMASVSYGDVIPTDPYEWRNRAGVMFKNPDWQFDSWDDLLQAHKKNGTSIGVVRPKEILEIKAIERPAEEVASFEQKSKEIRLALQAKRDQLQLYDELESSIPPEMKNLDFLQRRLKVSWLCNHPTCSGHNMAVLDWEVAELHRREGEQKALNALKSICNLDTHDLRFFLGNIFTHPSAFTIVGLWYPKRSANLSLF